MELIEKTVKSELIFDGVVVHLYRDIVSLPNGGQSVREIIKHVGAVCVVPITDEGEVLLERQYRYAVDEILTEIPAGKLDSADEDHAEAALRELREETGAIPKNLIDMGIFYGSPAIMGEKIHMYMATGLTFGERNLDDDEFLDVFRMPLDEAVNEIMAGRMPDGKTQAAILRAAALLKK
jgi:ADP-ribose pyrophosphatase